MSGWQRALSGAALVGRPLLSPYFSHCATGRIQRRPVRPDGCEHLAEEPSGVQLMSPILSPGTHPHQLVGCTLMTRREHDADR
jgi:hypothetical protein